MTTLLATQLVWAGECPWRSGVELFQPEYSEEVISLSVEEMNQDLDCLELLLENVYVGAKFNSQIDFKKRISELRKNLIPKTNDKFIGDLFKLHEGLIDLHLSYSAAGQTLRFNSSGSDFGLPMTFRKVGELYERTDEEGNSKLIGCKELEPIRLSSSLYIFRLRKGLKPEDPIHCTIEGGEERRFPQSYSIPNVFSNNESFDQDKIYHFPGDIIYFKPGSLINSNDAQKEIIEYVRHHDQRLIIDLLANPGGENIFPDALAQAIFSVNEKIPARRTYQISSGLQMIGFANTLFAIGHEAAEEFKRSIENYFTQNMAEIMEPLNTDWETVNLKGERETTYQSEIIILTSAECTSACESFLEYLSVHPKVKVLGKNTAGMTYYANSASYKLPNSGAHAYLPTIYSEPENDGPEGIGYPVDVKMDFIDLSDPEKLFKLQATSL